MLSRESACATITEKDDITLASLEVVDESVNVTAGGTIIAVNVNAHAGSVALNAAGAIAGNVVGGALDLDAGASISLNTAADTIDAQTSGPGAIIIAETDDVTLSNVEAYNGDITITVDDGILTAQSVFALADAKTIRLTTTSSGSIQAGQINAGEYGSIELVSAADKNFYEFVPCFVIELFRHKPDGSVD